MHKNKQIFNTVKRMTTVYLLDNHPFDCAMYQSRKSHKNRILITSSKGIIMNITDNLISFILAGIILCMRPANERQHYNVTASLAGCIYKMIHVLGMPCFLFNKWVFCSPFRSGMVFHSHCHSGQVPFHLCGMSVNELQLDILFYDLESRYDLHNEMSIYSSAGLK